jgi:hypothetical protein
MCWCWTYKIGISGTKTLLGYSKAGALLVMTTGLYPGAETTPPEMIFVTVAVVVAEDVSVEETVEA